MSIGFDSGCNNINFQGRYNLSNYKGCLKGGAIGDALGWPIEFNRLDDIKRKYGPNGIDDLVLNSKGKAEITDDTQIVLEKSSNKFAWTNNFNLGFFATNFHPFTRVSRFVSASNCSILA